jgi:1-deoxy-D-xylulose-5-phosphate reductoisomerase
MKLPIQFALSYPDRWECPADKLDLTKQLSLDFEPPDLGRFPALGLGFEAAEAGGTAGAVLNAANEAAVAEFLAQRLEFHEIVAVCGSVLANHEFDSTPTLQHLMDIDAWARREVKRWVCT